jgi:glycosyltransferase involved in cell wall biosynthesis
VLSTALEVIEVVPEGRPRLNPDLVLKTMTAKGTCDDELLLRDNHCNATEKDGTSSATPLRIIILGDTEVFDGMKTYNLDYIRALRGHNVHFTWMDTLCDGSLPDMDSREVGGEYVDPTVVGQAVLEAGGRLIRRCLVSHIPADEFYKYVAFEGDLYTARTWADMPVAFQTTFASVGAVFQQHDVVISAWNDHHGKTRQFLFLNQVAYLANPRMARLIDLSPAALPVPPDVQLCDYFVAMSHYVKSTRTHNCVVPTVVLQPFVDTDAFKKLHGQSPACASKFNKQPGDVLIGALFRVTASALGRRGHGTSTWMAGYVARLTSTKSPGMFLRVAAKLGKLLPNARFVLAGRETHLGFQSLMEQFAEDLGLTSRVKFLGFTARQDLNALYSCLDVVFFPSMTQFETFGIVNLVSAFAVSVVA